MLGMRQILSRIRQLHHEIRDIKIFKVSKMASKTTVFLQVPGAQVLTVANSDAVPAEENCNCHVIWTKKT